MISHSISAEQQCVPHVKTRNKVKRPTKLEFETSNITNRKINNKGFCSRIGNGVKGSWMSYFSFTSKYNQRKLVSSKSAPTKSGLTDEFFIKPFHRNSAPAFTFKPRSSSYIRLNYRKISLNDSDSRRKSQLTTIFANNETDPQTPILNNKKNSTDNLCLKLDNLTNSLRDSDLEMIQPDIRSTSRVNTKLLLHQSTIHSNEVEHQLVKITESRVAPPNEMDEVHELTVGQNKDELFKTPNSKQIETKSSSIVLTSNCLLSDDLPFRHIDSSNCTDEENSSLSNTQTDNSDNLDQNTPGPGDSRPSTGFEMETSMKERQWSVESQPTKTNSQHWRWSFRRCK